MIKVCASITFAAGRQNAVDVLVGSNSEEGAFLPGGPKVDEFVEQTRRRWGSLADAALRLYPHATDAEAARSSGESFRDGVFWLMRLYADYQVKRGNRAYLYYFTQNPPAPAGKPPFPATHASEVPYVFDNLGALHLYPDRSDSELAAASAPDRKLADEMSSYWVNFARNGNPNGRGLPKWPQHDLDSEGAIILDADPASKHLPDAARLALYDKLYEQENATR